MRRKLRSLIMAASLGLATVTLFSGCATGDRSGGQYMDDRVTSQRVKGALTDNPIYKFEDVNVNTYRGVVQLNGWVTHPEQKDVALNIARRTAGVLDVVNNISVKPQVQLVTPTGESQTGRPLSEAPPQNQPPPPSQPQNP